MKLSSPIYQPPMTSQSLTLRRTKSMPSLVERSDSIIPLADAKHFKASLCQSAGVQWIDKKIALGIFSRNKSIINNSFITTQRLQQEKIDLKQSGALAPQGDLDEKLKELRAPTQPLIRLPYFLTETILELDNNITTHNDHVLGRMCSREGTTTDDSITPKKTLSRSLSFHDNRLETVTNKIYDSQCQTVINNSGRIDCHGKNRVFSMRDDPNAIRSPDSIIMLHLSLLSLYLLGMTVVTDSEKEELAHLDRDLEQLEEWKTYNDEHIPSYYTQHKERRNISSNVDYIGTEPYFDSPFLNDLNNLEILSSQPPVQQYLVMKKDFQKRVEHHNIRHWEETLELDKNIDELLNGPEKEKHKTDISNYNKAKQLKKERKELIKSTLAQPAIKNGIGRKIFSLDRNQLKERIKNEKSIDENTTDLLEKYMENLEALSVISEKTKGTTPPLIIDLISKRDAYRQRLPIDYDNNIYQNEKEDLASARNDVIEYFTENKQLLSNYLHLHETVTSLERHMRRSIDIPAKKPLSKADLVRYTDWSKSKLQQLRFNTLDKESDLRQSLDQLETHFKTTDDLWLKIQRKLRLDHKLHSHDRTLHSKQKLEQAGFQMPISRFNEDSFRLYCSTLSAIFLNSSGNSFILDFNDETDRNKPRHSPIIANIHWAAIPNTDSSMVKTVILSKPVIN